MGQQQEDIEATGMTDEGAENGASTPQSQPPLYPAPQDSAPALDVDFLSIKTTDDSGDSSVTDSVPDTESAADAQPSPGETPDVQSLAQETVVPADETPEPAVESVDSESAPPAVARRARVEEAQGDKTRRVAVTVAAILASLLALSYFAQQLVPFAAAFLIAYLVNPITKTLEAWLGGRKLAVVGTLLIMAAAGYGIFETVRMSAMQSIGFINSLESVWTDIQRSVAMQKIDWKATDFNKTETGWTEFRAAWDRYVELRGENRDQALTEMRQRISGTYIGGLVDGQIDFVQRRYFKLMLGRFMNRIGQNGLVAAAAFLTVIGAGAVAIIVALYMVLIMFNLPAYAAFWKTLVPARSRDGLNRLLGEFDSAMRQYFVRQAIAAVITAGIFAFGFAYLKLPLSLPMALGLGFLGMIPYLQVVGLAPAIFLALYRSVDQQVAFVPTITQLLILFAVVIAVQELILKPVIVGRGETIERLAVLLGVFLWPQLLGFYLGVLLAIPITCLGIAWYRLQREKQEQLAAAELADARSAPALAYATAGTGTGDAESSTTAS